MSNYCEAYLRETEGTMDHWGLLMWFNNMKAFTKIADAMTCGQSFNGLCFCPRPVMRTVVTQSTARWVKIGGDHMQVWENERKGDKELLALSADLTVRVLHSLQGCRGPLICFLWINSVYKHHWNVTPAPTSYWFSELGGMCNDHRLYFWEVYPTPSLFSSGFNVWYWSLFPFFLTIFRKALLQIYNLKLWDINLQFWEVKLELWD